MKDGNRQISPSSAQITALVVLLNSRDKATMMQTNLSNALGISAVNCGGLDFG
ncbi:hypothetical protein CAMRE0001_0853 [Campylobacter rectus RM3267]|uniref:Uncharacterized protein n=1 Tax=Campylobacter rectus RM3267 TaxID=553218 RepID=B9D1X9_CAMRE|nr:hypothetical protein CAMRE0001_0853 [Campylobacter rectus RM3267]